MAGRAARNINGTVIMYADNITKSMKNAIGESERRRKKQIDFNKKYKISPGSIKKKIRQGIEELQEAEKLVIDVAGETNQEHEFNMIVSELEYEMEMAARNLQFEKAAVIRDKIKDIKKKGF